MRFCQRLNNKIDSTTTNLKEADSKMAALKPKEEEKISVTYAPQQPALLSYKSHDERIINNITIKLIIGTIEKEGANVSESITSL